MAELDQAEVLRQLRAARDGREAALKVMEAGIHD